MVEGSGPRIGEGISVISPQMNKGFDPSGSNPLSAYCLIWRASARRIRTLRMVRLGHPDVLPSKKQVDLNGGLDQPVLTSQPPTLAECLRLQLASSIR